MASLLLETAELLQLLHTLRQQRMTDHVSERLMPSAQRLQSQGDCVRCRSEGDSLALPFNSDLQNRKHSGMDVGDGAHLCVSTSVSYPVSKRLDLPDPGASN